MTGLAGRIVVVTGASRGIGRETAATLAREGASVIAVGRDVRLLEDLTAGLPGQGHRYAAMDVRNEAAWTKLVADLDRIDGVVAAAGVYGPIGRIDTLDVSEMRDAFDVNLFGSLLAVRACLSRLAESGGSAVLFGGGGSDPLPGYDAYLASKAAVVRLAENLAAELAGLGVRVNAVAPGFVVTDIHRATLAAVAARRRGGNKPRPFRHYLLRGLLTCACGTRMRGEAHLQRGTERRYYRCPKLGCRARRCPADSVEEIVMALAHETSDFAQATLQTILEKSPTGLKLTLKLLRAARASSSVARHALLEMARPR